MYANPIFNVFQYLHPQVFDKWIYDPIYGYFERLLSQLSIIIGIKAAESVVNSWFYCGRVKYYHLWWLDYIKWIVKVEIVLYLHKYKLHSSLTIIIIYLY